MGLARIHAVLAWLVVAAPFALLAQTLGPFTYDEITFAIEGLCKSHSGSCELFIAQDLYKLPSPGMCGKAQDKPCVTQILHITNFSTYERDKVTRPQVFISGELHGDERVGPHASLEYARLLLESKNEWIRHLVNTRSIWITPITNSLGFDRNTREEGSVDPNRDYPIDQNADMCMKAIVSRIANEIFRSHMFQLAITFHGGMEAIAMEWGTKSRVSRDQHKSPDDFALLQIGGGLAKYAGPVTPNGRDYPVGRMNDLVYPVAGGMEDWAYAGNWDPGSKRIPCNPQTFGGYPTSKTQYSDDMLRVVNILVETSDRKWPSDFGTPNDILNAKSGTGHVPRNVRLALMLTDIVQPYIRITSSQIDKMGRLQLTWEVGGSFEVDETWAEILVIQNQGGSKMVHKGDSLTGLTRWATGTYQDREMFPFKPRFSACFVLPNEMDMMGRSIELIAQVKAKVDSSWKLKNQLNTVNPEGFPPQTHLVNARTNAYWSKTNAGFQIQGKVEWESDTISISVDSQRGRRFLHGGDEEKQSPNPDMQDVISVNQCSRIKLSGGSQHSDSSSGEVEDESAGSATSGMGSFHFSWVIVPLALVSVLVGAVYLYRTDSPPSLTHQPVPTTDVDDA